MRLLENRERDVAARKRIEDFLVATGRHGDRRIILEEVADERSVAITRVPGYRKWIGTADVLVEEDKAILADRDTCGPRLDNTVIGKQRWTELPWFRGRSPGWC